MIFSARAVTGILINLLLFLNNPAGRTDSVSVEYDIEGPVMSYEFLGDLLSLPYADIIGKIMYIPHRDGTFFSAVSISIAEKKKEVLLEVSFKGKILKDEGLFALSEPDGSGYGLILCAADPEDPLFSDFPLYTFDFPVWVFIVKEDDLIKLKKEKDKSKLISPKEIEPYLVSVSVLLLHNPY